jgi:hypothetical protein
MAPDYRDLVIIELADSEAALREQAGALIDVIADLAWENYWLSVIADCAFRHPYQRKAQRDDASGQVAA